MIRLSVSQITMAIPQLQGGGVTVNPSPICLEVCQEITKEKEKRKEERKRKRKRRKSQ